MLVKRAPDWRRFRLCSSVSFHVISDNMTNCLVTDLNKGIFTDWLGVNCIYAEDDPSFLEFISCNVSPIDLYDRWLNSAIINITSNGYVGNKDLV